MQIQKTIGEFVGESKAPLLGRDATVGEAIKVMTERNSTCVLVVEDDKLIGIFTERDFLMRVVASKLDVNGTPLRDVMTASPDALRLTDCITYAVNLMGLGGYRNVPIVDDDNRPISNLSVYYVTSHLAEVFSEFDEGSSEQDEWTDIGGGG